MPPRSTDASPTRSGRRRGQGPKGEAGAGGSDTARKRKPRRKKTDAGSAAAKGRGGDSRSSRRGSRQFHGPSVFDALTRRNAVLLWFSGLLLFALLWLYPVSDSATRTLSLVLLFALPLGLVGLWWRVPLLRWALIALLLLLGGYWFLPGRTSFDRRALREETAHALRRYEGVRYWNDGEGRYGVDGPGLVRRGIIEATFLHGLHTLNPWLVRRSVAFWWGDLSAAELLPSARGAARRYTVVKSLRDLNPGVLYPGDFVVTGDRQHVLAYLGSQRWLFPDPESGRVVVIDLRETKHPIADTSISLMRWRILEAPRPHNVYAP